MKRISRADCQVPKLAFNNPRSNGEHQDEHDMLVAQALRHILHDSTDRYSMDRMLAVHMIEDDTPMPPRTLTDIRWPHHRTIYIEYDEPIILDPADPEDEHVPRQSLNGLIIAQQPDRNTFLTIGITNQNFSVTQHSIDRLTGQLSNDEEHDAKDPIYKADSMRALRFYARLAIHMNVDKLM